MLTDLRDLLELAYEVRLEAKQARVRHPENALAWRTLTRVIDTLNQTTDTLLTAYVELAAQEKATPPAPEVVA